MLARLVATRPSSFEFIAAIRAMSRRPLSSMRAKSRLIASYRAFKWRNAEQCFPITGRWRGIPASLRPCASCPNRRASSRRSTVARQGRQPSRRRKFSGRRAASEENAQRRQAHKRREATPNHRPTSHYFDERHWSSETERRTGPLMAKRAQPIRREHSAPYRTVRSLPSLLDLSVAIDERDRSSIHQARWTHALRALRCKPAQLAV